MTMMFPRTRARRRFSTSRLLADPRFEILPLAGVEARADEFPPGAVVAVTSSPSRDTMTTVELAETLAAKGLRPVPHLSARQMRDHAELAEVLQRLDHAGIRDAFVVGGDGAGGAFANGLELLRAMDAIGHRLDRIGVPSYPEGHANIDEETLWTDLRAKQEYASYTVTQLCFDARAVCRFVAAARARDITLPVTVGVPGAVDVARLLRVSLRIGIGDSVRFLRGNRAVITKLLRPRGYRPDGLVRQLGAHVDEGDCELAGLHIYTFNHVEASVRWAGQLRGRLEPGGREAEAAR